MGRVHRSKHGGFKAQFLIDHGFNIRFSPLGVPLMKKPAEFLVGGRKQSVGGLEAGVEVGRPGMAVLEIGLGGVIIAGLGKQAPQFSQMGQHFPGGSVQVGVRRAGRKQACFNAFPKIFG